MSRQTDTDWIVEGARVAELNRKFMDDRVEFTTIERLTATQIVCASGTRYRRDTLGAVGGDRLELVRPNDPRVQNAVARDALSNVRFRVDNLCKDHNGDAGDVLDTLDAIERLVAEARAAINGTYTETPKD